jgi:putative tryptophan/tyrosine transport system substrate-binding protein
MAGRGPRVERLRRRDFIALLGAAAAWPSAVQAQSGTRVRRIGVLMSNAEADPEGQARMAALREGLAEFGWKDGGNLRIEWRWSGDDLKRIETYAAELVSLAPELIVANGSANLRVLRDATQTIPIVFAVVNDPVGQGFITNLARPGGNITGFTFLEYSMVAKALDMLKQVAPSVARVAVMFNPETYPFYDVHLPSVESDAARFSIKVVRAAVASDAEIETTIAQLAREPGGGLLVPPDTYTLVHRATIVAAAARHRVPTIHAYRQSVREGGLMSYGADTLDIFRRAGSYVDRILKGASPGDLPAQAPVKFELVVNLKAAAALGLTFPSHLLALAEEVIE